MSVNLGVRGHTAGSGDENVLLRPSSYFYQDEHISQILRVSNIFICAQETRHLCQALRYSRGTGGDPNVLSSSVVKSY